MINQFMQSMVLNNVNGSLDFEKRNLPQLKRNESLIQLKAAALNHRDLWISIGMYSGIKFPTILGSDGMGYFEDREVIICPSVNWGDNERFQGKNFEVLGLPRDGTLAEYIAVPNSLIYDKPQHLSTHEAAALPLAGLTAYRALIVRGAAKKSDKVLVSGVGGGVALMAMQLAIAGGMEVYVTSGNRAKIESAMDLGAKGGWLYSEVGYGKKIKKETGGIDLVIDSAAGNHFNELVEACSPGARISIYGATRGNIEGLNPRIVFWKQISILGTTMGSIMDFENMLAYVSRHKVHPVVDSVYNLKDTNQALRKMKNGFQFGKIVISIPSK